MEISSSCNLENYFKEYEKKEIVTENEEKFVKKTKIVLPPVLIINITSNERYKQDFPEEFLFKNRAKYKLFSVIILDRDPSNLHYICISKHNEEWLKIDGEDFVKCSFKDITSNSNYSPVGLFYENID